MIICHRSTFNSSVNFTPTSSKCELNASRLNQFSVFFPGFGRGMKS
uniref:Uncharacterized protein n=1 Tax=Rhizophora mucronata TaxID=61149 RepID=A0A2P2PMW8_RHIMU